MLLWSHATQLYKGHHDHISGQAHFQKQKHMDSHQFSERENDLIRLLLEGKSNKQIALELGISSRTVEFHLSRIYAKLGVTSRTEAALRLSKPDLRKSAGGDPRETTDAPRQESDHNSRTSIFMKRIPMNKSFIIGIGLWVITSVFCVGSLYVMAKERARAKEMPSNAITTPILSPVPSGPVESATPASTSPTPGPQLTNIVIPPHSVNGYTAAIESYYVDSSHVMFQVRIIGGKTTFGDENFYFRFRNANLYDENRNEINTSGGWGPAVNPALIEFSFVPLTLFQGGHFKGQFAFELMDAPNYDETVAQFRFDLDLPLYPERRFDPKQMVVANGLEILLDSVTITPTFTQAYLCFPPPSFAPWQIGSQTILQLGKQEATLYNVRLLFGADLGGDLRAGSEPYWTPPTKNGRCMKIGFPLGSSNPTSLTLTVPELENIEPDILMTGQFLTDYSGLSAKEAYYTYLAEHGKTYKGPWIFTVNLTP
jgi:DNA-binding CsgD family transcriptional regulator